MCFSWENQQNQWEIFQQAMFGGTAPQTTPSVRQLANSTFCTQRWLGNPWKNMYLAWVYVSIHHEYPTNLLLYNHTHSSTPMWDTHVQYGGIVHVLASCSHARTCSLGRPHAWSVTRQSWWLQSILFLVTLRCHQTWIENPSLISIFPAINLHR